MIVDYINYINSFAPSPPPFFSNFADFDDCYSLAYYVDIARKNLKIPQISGYV